MGRGRGKGKKLTVVSHEDEGSSEEEKIPVQKRRGRPQKPLKDDDTDEDDSEKIEEGDSDHKDSSLSGKEMNQKTIRKRNHTAKEKPGLVKEENGGATKPIPDNPAKPVIRSSGKRRKGTPHRAAESGVPFGY